MQAASLFALFSLPWVEVYFRVDEGSYRIIAPVKLGLFACFSDICRDYETKYFSFPAALVDAAAKPEVLRLPGLDPRKFERLQFPFYVASLTCAALLAAGAVASALSVALLLYGFSDVPSKPLDSSRFLLAASTLLSSSAAVTYILITTQLLNGGQFLLGLWLTLSASVLGVATSLALLRLDDDAHSYTTLD